MASRGYALAFALGAVAGGAALAWGTKAAPRMMAGMMQRMMAHMKAAGCNPQEMWRQMMGAPAGRQPGS